MAGSSSKSILYALLANFGIAITKTVAAIISGSGSMLAEAIHSYADCGNQGLLFLGLKSAKKPPSDKYPLGYGKEIYFWSFIVALILFSLGGLFSIYEGYHKLHTTESIKSPGLAIGVLVFSIILESFSLYGCLKEIKPLRSNKSLWKWSKESNKSELVVVLGEDIAALLGLILAVIGVSLAIITNNPFYDALGSISIGVLLVIVSVFIAIKIKGLLIGKGISEKEKQQITEIILSNNEVVKILNLLTLQMGEDVLVAVKVKFKEGLSASELILNINNIEQDIKQQNPAIQWLFFEPDNLD